MKFLFLFYILLKYIFATDEVDQNAEQVDYRNSDTISINREDYQAIVELLRLLKQENTEQIKKNESERWQLFAQSRTIDDLCEKITKISSTHLEEFFPTISNDSNESEGYDTVD
ncbi:hypothetical protein EDEG_01980 [Edhazardia aedis USNM 41457]|uniref:Uncharacterized protein n=1 Tax=Edhazardia aedis (strain USNM 41457) TaxID=1003232 RepID=J9DQY5_EDHAE|nr:hypothetical protein EDEG_01980 [Edhazardia aedis USNM 41457]|eukprot:EJW03742.1 hypothetical protein EDEG_01980 [Edhazardia aedis USNM 41457]